MSSVIIAVVVVLGIIVAGGFLLYFLGDLLMGISGKKKDVDAIREKQLKKQKDLEARVNALENSQEAKKDPQIATVLFNGGMVEAYNPNEEEAVEEAVVEDFEETEEYSEEPVEETEEPAEETQEAEEAEDDTSEYIRQRRKELLERLARMQEEREETAEQDDSEDLVDLSEDTVEAPVEEPVETETVEEPVEETTEETEEESTEEAPAEDVASEETVEETVEEAEETVAEETAVETETPAEEVVEETVEEKAEEALAEKVRAEAITVAVADGSNALAANFTLEELEARLVEEQEKLKSNEKELRQCKKEFIPLRRVKNTLESDEKKLRRKEALVAKQKVVLYGVNNYADIDEEKAQKLAEDLDLLDGLKLSVQHCQEVMDKNQERYPLLEKIFNLLNSQNEQIKEDIKNIQDAIAQLKGEGDQE
ncbi:MAG: hypothetical protein HFI85_03050 [Clostridia bacterium]|jgi:hypothetical protein|nr:hypothetical protein [Clostridia bacterium]